MIRNLKAFIILLAALILSSHELATKFEDIDLDKNGALSFNEFNYYAAKIPGIQDQHFDKKQMKATLKILFTTHDTDKNQELSLKEYKKFMRMIEKTLAQREKPVSTSNKEKKSKKDPSKSLEL